MVNLSLMVLLSPYRVLRGFLSLFLTVLPVSLLVVVDSPVLSPSEQAIMRLKPHIPDKPLTFLTDGVILMFLTFLPVLAHSPAQGPWM